MTEKQCILLLWYLVNASPKAFYKLFNYFKSAESAINQPVTQWQSLNIHASHIERFQDYKTKGKPKAYLECLTAVKSHQYEVVFYDDADYPMQLDVLPDKPPLLFVKGNKSVLNQPQIAIVGSRKPSQSARTITEEFAQTIASEGIWITSGLAVGIDKHAHIGALKQGQGRTVVVLGNGIDTCYPKQNLDIYQQVIASGGVIISELLPHTPPLAHNFPRRNRIVSGISLATLVVEAAVKSGSLITAGFAAEQGKIVFAIPGHIHNSQSKGCHHLIREGAILVDEPMQVIEDINLPRRIHHDIQESVAQMVSGASLKQNTNAKSNQPNNHEQSVTKNKNQPIFDANQTGSTVDRVVNSPVTVDEPPQQNLPEHLKVLLTQLDWTGTDMDKLIELTQLDIATLSSQLMELELHGLVIQTAGLYMRCRQS